MIREARRNDAAALSRLIDLLGFSATPEEVARRVDDFHRRGQPVLVADADGPVGCLTWHVMPVLHRDTDVGRISMLIVEPRCRGLGIGFALVGEAERRVADAGCTSIEVTSNVRLEAAHGFYQRLGYRQTSHRFEKSLQPELLQQARQ